MTTKQCNTCNELKDISEFGLTRNPDNPKSTNYRAQSKLYKSKCKACDAAYARAWRKKNKNYHGSGLLSKYPAKDRKLLSCISSKLWNCKSNNKQRKKGLVFEITRDWLFELFHKQNGLCAISGLEMTAEVGSLRCLSIDKIDPYGDYTKDNVQLLCWAVNRAKGEIKQQEFIKLCKIIAEKCND